MAFRAISCAAPVSASTSPRERSLHPMALRIFSRETCVSIHCCPGQACGRPRPTTTAPDGHGCRSLKSEGSQVLPRERALIRPAGHLLPSLRDGRRETSPRVPSPVRRMGEGARRADEGLSPRASHLLTLFLHCATTPIRLFHRRGTIVDSVSQLRISPRHLRRRRKRNLRPGREGRDPGALRPPRREAVTAPQGGGKQAPSLSDKRRAGQPGASRPFFSINWIA